MLGIESGVGAKKKIFLFPTDSRKAVVRNW